MSDATTQPGRTIQPPKRLHRPAVDRRLRRWLIAVFVLLALLGANSIYLAVITFLDWWTGRTYENWFYQYMFLGHIALGLLLIGPFLVFALRHMWVARHRRNRRAVKVGYALFGVSLVILGSGLTLLRIEGFELREPTVRAAVYWSHVIAPLIAVWLYWLHRLTGPRLRWKAGVAYLAVAVTATAAMLALHHQDPRAWHRVGDEQSVQHFAPSLARTSHGNYLPARSLMMDRYCKQCHPDAHAGWSASVHRFSSFNNPAYLASVRETRSVLLKRDGNVKASRWCAGCHDPVPLFSGAFDDPEFDDVRHPTSQAGITCTVCHAITHINSTRGNADYTIEEPLHYPFAYSDNPVLQWINRQLVKAKPAFHKKTFLKPFHRTAEFCSVCHKVHLPYELTRYKEFLRGQNHYDSYLLSGVSGHGARSFYYPPHAAENCSKCHMPLRPSNDFGARFFGTNELSIHDHLFVGANTAVAWMKGHDEAVRRHQQFLQDCVRVDIFGLREDGKIDGRLIAPIRPEVPTLQPGKTYLLEIVIRTLKVGHHLTQGTVDSNQLWLDVTVRSGDRLIGRSGAIDEQGRVDPWSHFVNAFVLDRHGRRIDRRNAQDIFVALYNHQIPPGAGQTVHYELHIPEDVREPVDIAVSLNYRKFDAGYWEYFTTRRKKHDHEFRGADQRVNPLPVTVMARDVVRLPVAGGDPLPADSSGEKSTEVAAADGSVEPPAPLWERWNDYGIGLLLKGRAELRQAEQAFREVERLGRVDGPVNLARVYFQEGRLQDAADALRRAAGFDDPAAYPWTLAWLSGLVNRQENRLEAAEHDFRNILTMRTPEMIRRGFDFSLDYLVRNQLGGVLFDRARRLRTPKRRAERNALLRQAADVFQSVLDIDAENLTAHYNLAQIYTLLGDKAKAEQHARLHDRYRPDDNARGEAVRIARQLYPAANHAAEAVVIYPLAPPPVQTSRADGE
ncbi:MAG: hypothetical protein D6725_15985 [Planctomycetota bacterium]|nr:MAG: hypothetical protein D6725_15985 [Planctomycetota bacterium]